MSTILEICSMKCLTLIDVNTDGMKIGAQELSGGPQNETDSLFDFDSQENDSVVAEMIDDGDLELLRRFETEQIDEDDLTDGELERLIAVRDKRDRNFKVFELQQQKKLKKEAQAIRQTQSLSCKNDLTPFKLGMENSHRRYVNHYRTENAARPYAERKQETIKMRMIWSKFCPKEVENFNWKLSDYMSDPNNGFRNMLRTALIDFSRRLPSAFFHPKWKSADSDWKFSLLKAVEPPQFAKCLAIIEAFSRSVVFMPYFFTGISDTELVRETVVERERRKLLEKMRKDRKQREDAALSGNPENLESSTNDSDIVWVKYPNGLPKHQIWKGNSDEFYRVNGRGCLGGWIWFSCNWAPLGRRGAKLAGFRGHIECEESSYKSFINDLLKEVMLNEMERNTITEYPDGSSLLIGSASSQMACATLPLTFAVGGSSWVPERLMTIEKLQLRRHYPTVDVSLGLRDKSIYYTAAKESFLDGLLKIRSCILTAEATRNPIRLKNVSGGHKFRPNSFPAAQSFLCRRSSKRSILVLPKTICRQLARHGGNLTEIPGYIEVTKSNTFAWPYPCSRPNFQTCWRYTLNSNQISLASVAFHLRQLHSLIRWNDVDKSGQNPAKVITHDEGLLTQTEILHHKEISMSNQQMYLVKTIRLRYEMLEEDGRKARNRRILKGVLKPHMKEVTADTQWLSEHDVSLAQIRHYHEKIANQLSFSFDSSTVVTSADIDQLIKNALTVEVEDEFRDRLHHLALEHRTSAFTPKSQREDNDNRMTMTTRRAFAEEKMAPLDAILTYGKYDYKVAKLMDTEERNEYWR